MQTLYDIHTHKIASQPPEGYKLVSIVNTYPHTANLVNIDDVYYSCGMHPWYLDNAREQFDRLKEVVKNNRVVAVGEAGLDKIQGGDWLLQMEYFRKQIELAEEIQKPLIIHCVKAWNELIDLHKEYMPKNTWIVHGFRGKPELAEQLVRKGIKISLGNSFNPQVLKRISLDSIFCETDDNNISILSIYCCVCENAGICIADMSDAVAYTAVNTFKL